MTSLIQEFLQVAQDYSDLLEDSEWGLDQRKPFVPIGYKSIGYSDLLEDTEWA